jgi:gliding motility associated protien GldN
MRTFAFFSPLVLMLAGSTVAFAQVNKEAGVLDGEYKEIHTVNRKLVPYTDLREADAVWKKRVWRIIDIREKINLPLYYPIIPNSNRISAFDALKNALKLGEIKAYEFEPDLDESFKIELTPTEVAKKFSSLDSTQTETGGDTVIKVEITADKIRQYMLKEDWYLDKQRSVMDVRILGICPTIVTINKNSGKEDETIPPTQLFWVYFPTVRDVFKNITVFNNHNDAEQRTVEDIFRKRMFSSYMFENNNVYGRTIAQTEKGLDFLLAGEKIKADMFGIEQDLWQY